ncbi:MAG TPA: hypothetical protein PLB89_05885 [Flavobacteriales bacterium]|nr:hypothetical protein [Flavobacteriales bacterium]
MRTSSTGFDPQILSRLSRIGARPVKRLIRKELLNPDFHRGRLG